MANAGPRKPAKGSSKRRPTKRTPNWCLLLPSSRGYRQRKRQATTRSSRSPYRVATLESRDRDLNELIVGHRERIAAS